MIISSYSISDKRFEAVYSFDKARSTLKGGRNYLWLKTVNI
jgi:hypothetical protein